MRPAMQVQAVLLVIFSLHSVVHARRGAFLNTKGAFTMTSSSNRGGNTEEENYEAAEKLVEANFLDVGESSHATATAQNTSSTTCTTTDTSVLRNEMNRLLTFIESAETAKANLVAASDASSASSLIGGVSELGEGSAEEQEPLTMTMMAQKVNAQRSQALHDYARLMNCFRSKLNTVLPPANSSSPTPPTPDAPAPGPADTPAPGPADTPAPGPADTPAPGPPESMDASSLPSPPTPATPAPVYPSCQGHTDPAAADTPACDNQTKREECFEMVDTDLPSSPFRVTRVSTTGGFLEKFVSLRLFRHCSMSNDASQQVQNNFLNAKMAVPVCGAVSCADIDRMISMPFFGDDELEDTAGTEPNTNLAIDLHLKKVMHTKYCTTVVCNEQKTAKGNAASSWDCTACDGTEPTDEDVSSCPCLEYTVKKTCAIRENAKGKVKDGDLSKNDGLRNECALL